MSGLEEKLFGRSSNMAKVFVVALDGVAEVAKIIAGDFAIQLSGWTEMAVAAVAAVTVL